MADDSRKTAGKNKSGSAGRSLTVKSGGLVRHNKSDAMLVTARCEFERQMLKSELCKSIALPSLLGAWHWVVRDSLGMASMIAYFGHTFGMMRKTTSRLRQTGEPVCRAKTTTKMVDGKS